MNSQLPENMGTLVASIVFASIFFFGAKLRMPVEGEKYYRRVLSFAAGVSIAYVFVDLLPQLQNVTEVFVSKTGHLLLPFPSYRVYLSAMLGFVASFGLENMLKWSKEPSERTTDENDTGKEKLGLIIHLGGFSVYVWLINYLMADNIEGKEFSIPLYAVAMGLHFLTIEYSLRREYGPLFNRSSKNVLAVACLLGWIMGTFFKLPPTVVITLLGIISGSVVMNSTIAELPKEKEGRFLAFLIGAILYASILLLVR